MENKITDSIKHFLTKEGSKVKIIVAIGLIGIILIFASDIFSKNNTSDHSLPSQSADYNDYVENLEKKLENIISSIDGVGECKVMIILENTNESVYATDNERKTDAQGENTQDKYVIYNSDNGETPVLIKEYFPTVQGVSIVCSGGNNIEVKEKIINTVTALFNIAANRVSVSKIKS